MSKKMKKFKKEDANLRRAVPKDSYLITDEKNMKIQPCYIESFLAKKMRIH